jgi:hypothetical protein
MKERKGSGHHNVAAAVASGVLKLALTAIAKCRVEEIEAGS